MCATWRSLTAAASAAMIRRPASRATAAASSRTTISAPPNGRSTPASSATEQPHRADERLLEGAVKAWPLERLRDEGRLIERFEAARAARDGRAVPVGGGEQVIGLARDPGAHLEQIGR